VKQLPSIISTDPLGNTPEALEVPEFEEGADPIEAIAPVCGARRLFTGQVVDVQRSTQAGFVRGRLVLKGLDDNQAHLQIEKERIRKL